MRELKAANLLVCKFCVKLCTVIFLHTAPPSTCILIVISHVCLQAHLFCCLACLALYLGLWLCVVYRLVKLLGKKEVIDLPVELHKVYRMLLQCQAKLMDFKSKLSS